MNLLVPEFMPIFSLANDAAIPRHQAGAQCLRVIHDGFILIVRDKKASADAATAEKIRDFSDVKLDFAPVVDINDCEFRALATVVYRVRDYRISVGEGCDIISELNAHRIAIALLHQQNLGAPHLFQINNFFANQIREQNFRAGSNFKSIIAITNTRGFEKGKFRERVVAKDLCKHRRHQ